MNPYKLKAIVEFVRDECKKASIDMTSVHQMSEFLRWCGVLPRLAASEQVVVMRELVSVAEAEDFMDQVRVDFERA